MSEDPRSAGPITRNKKQVLQKQANKDKYNANRRKKRELKRLAQLQPVERGDRIARRNVLKQEAMSSEQSVLAKLEKAKALREKQREKREAVRENVKKKVRPKKTKCIYCRKVLQGEPYARVPGYVVTKGVQKIRRQRSYTHDVSASDQNKHRALILSQCAQKWKEEGTPFGWTEEGRKRSQFSPKHLVQKSAAKEGTCFIHTKHFQPAHIEETFSSTGVREYRIKYVYNHEVRGIVSLPKIVDGKLTGQHSSPVRRKSPFQRAAASVSMSKESGTPQTLKFYSRKHEERLKEEEEQALEERIHRVATTTRFACVLLYSISSCLLCFLQVCVSIH